MSETPFQPFAKKWMFISMAIFIASEILIGIFIGNIIVGRYVSMGLQFMLQGFCMILAFFVGGVIVGFISPGLRVFEPAVGAFLSVSTMGAITLLTPSRFFHFSLTKVILGGALAFGLALAGAKIGEKLSGNKV
mgnify:CR=1 FL=1|jgi:hypothetical protein